MVDLPNKFRISRTIKDDVYNNVSVYLVTNGDEYKVIKSVDLQKTDFYSNYYTHLHHQNIVHCSKIYESKGRLNYLLEFCDGKDLSILISNVNEIQRLLFTISLQLLSGIAYLHSNGVIHGDLKSENIILVQDMDGNFILKLLDYNNHLNVHMNPEDICATPEYSSPQQLDGVISKSSDIWSLGCILFEIITSGSLPFGKRKNIGLQKVIHKIKNDPLPKEILNFPYPFNYIIYKCLRKEENNRFSNCLEIISILNKPLTVSTKIKHYLQIFTGIILGEIK